MDLGAFLFGDPSLTSKVPPDSYRPFHPTPLKILLVIYTDDHTF